MASGGILWGYVASQSSITYALCFAATTLLLGIGMAAYFKLPVTDAEDLTPSLHWPVPALVDGEDHERGPVMVTIEYQIAPEHWSAFQHAMQEVRHMRRRNGSFSWGLVQDSENRQRWLEFFFDESWLEHLRHHNRVTREEQRIEARARQYQSAGVAVQIRHLLDGHGATQ